MLFIGKTVVVTGASMGIGEAVAAAFASRGANVVLAARSRELLEQVAARLAPGPGKVVTVPCDVTRPDDVARLAETSLAVTGRVDVLINNAGVGMTAPVERLDPDLWRQCLEVNLIGAVRVIQAFLPSMKAAGNGSIVQVSSVLGKISAPYTGGYNASKFALNAISDALRLEVARHGVRVISVYPGSTESNFRTNALGEPRSPKVRFRQVPASQVAERIARAVERGDRDVYITFRDAALGWAASRLPRLTDRVLKLVYRNKQ